MPIRSNRELLKFGKVLLPISLAMGEIKSISIWPCVRKTEEVALEPLEQDCQSISFRYYSMPKYGFGIAKMAKPPELGTFTINLIITK